jgi:hypothetical protein
MSSGLGGAGGRTRSGIRPAHLLDRVGAAVGTCAGAGPDGAGPAGLAVAGPAPGLAMGRPTDSRHAVNERPSGCARGLADRDRASCYRRHRLAGCPPGQQAAHTGPARSIDRCTATPPGIGGEPAVVPGCRRYPHKAIMLKPLPGTRPRHCGRRVPGPGPGLLALPIRRRRAHDGTPVRLCDAPAGQAGRVRGHVPCRGGDGRAT